MSRANSKTAAKPAAKPNTPATAQTGNTAEVSATVATQVATPAAPLQSPSNSANGTVESLPPVGEGSAAGPLADIVVEGIIVISEVEGFRRAGRAWSRTATTVPLTELDEEAIKALQAEPLLTVAYFGIDPAKTAG